MARSNVNKQTLPPYLTRNSKDDALIAFIKTISHNWKEPIKEIIERLANQQVSVSIIEPVIFDEIIISDLITKETTYIKIFDKDGKIIILITLEWRLIDAISQASLGAIQYRMSSSNRPRTQFEKSFSHLLSKAIGEAVSNLFMANTSYQVEISDIGYGPLSERDERSAEKFNLPIHISVKIFDIECSLYILFFTNNLDNKNNPLSSIATVESKAKSYSKIMSGLSQTYLTVNAILRGNGFHLSDISTLKKGSILKLGQNLPDTIVLTIQDNEFAFCSLGRDEDKLTVRIDKITEN